MPLIVPPLRDRISDIITLANFFLKKYSQITGNEFKGFDEQTVKIMKKYNWPGNVRELENAIQYAVNVEKMSQIFPSSIPKNIKENVYFSCEKQTLKDKVCNFERDLIKKALKTYGHSVESKKTIAKELGVSLPTLYRKIKDHRL